MLVVTRYRVGAAGPAFLRQAESALLVLAGCPGYLRGWVGRATDDPELWVLATEWVSVGTYRRALSSYDVRVQAIPLLARAIDEPTAFEVLVATDDPEQAGVRRSAVAADGGIVALGEGAAPMVATDLDEGR